MTDKTVKNKGGRPPKWNTPKDFDSATEAYFVHCKNEFLMPNKAGLAVFLGTHKDTLSEYSKKDGFSDSIKRAYVRIEQAWVQRLNSTAPTGAIFYLKAALGYRDQIEIDHTSQGERMGVILLPQKHEEPEQSPTKGDDTVGATTETVPSVS